MKRKDAFPFHDERSFPSLLNLSIDETDLRILKSLRENAMRSHKEIGELVHLTGQAVGARVRKLEESGIIEGYTVRVDNERLGLPLTAMVTVFLKSGEAHERFLSFASNDERVEEIHRVSGEGCYWLRMKVENHERLTDFLDGLLRYGNYKLSLSIGLLKRE
jgi:Lrp/AsnC family leucine-responsive transcriptional regulator